MFHNILLAIMCSKSLQIMQVNEICQQFTASYLCPFMKMLHSFLGLVRDAVRSKWKVLFGQGPPLCLVLGSLSTPISWILTNGIDGWCEFQFCAFDWYWVVFWLCISLWHLCLGENRVVCWILSRTGHLSPLSNWHIPTLLPIINQTLEQCTCKCTISYIPTVIQVFTEKMDRAPHIIIKLIFDVVFYQFLTFDIMSIVLFSFLTVNVTLILLPFNHWKCLRSARYSPRRVYSPILGAITVL